MISRPSLVASGDIRLDGLTLGYDRHPAVHHLDGIIRRGDLLALVGPNGAGKSTLLKGLIGEIPSLDGQIHRGMPARTLAYLPQADEIDRSFPLSVLDLASMGLWRSSGAWRSLLGHRSAVLSALDAVGLAGFEARPIGTLSGGQFQRVLFARLILQDAQVLLLDEPFTGVDARTTADLIALIRTWHGEGRTIVAALHDLVQVRAHFPKTLLLAREPVAWGATASVLSPQNLARATRLSEAWDEDAAICAHDHVHAAPALDEPRHVHEHHGPHHHPDPSEPRETAA